MNHENPGDRPRPKGPTGVRGFTLIELLVVLAIVAFAMVIGIPALQNMVVRSRTEGFCRETSTLIQRARLESIRRNRPAVVFLDDANDQLVAFVDVDGNRSYDPDPNAPYRTADYEIARLTASRTLRFEAPLGGTDQNSIDGLTLIGVDRWAIFQPDGSIDDEGAFRVSDLRGNHLEIRIAPPATARVELRKWHDQDEEWKDYPDPQAPDYEPWEWK